MDSVGLDLVSRITDNSFKLRICIPIQEDEGPVRTFSSVRGMLDIDQVAVPWLAQVNYIRSMIHPAVFDPSASITLSKMSSGQYFDSLF